MIMTNTKLNLQYIGIGSGKCGSTWIHELIVKHPEACDKNLKELNYFSDLYEAHNFDWYQSQFKKCCPDSVKGEFSVTYLANPKAPIRIKKHFPEVKLIVTVRNPVKRAFSNYLHSIRKGDISKKMSFRDYIKNENNLAPGRYCEYVKRFYDEFPKEQIHVIVLEEFLKDIPAGIKALYSHIGIKNVDFLPEGFDVPSNDAKNYRFLLLENVLVRCYRWLSWKGQTRFVKWVLDSGIAKALRRINSSRDPLPTIDEESSKMLSDYFSPYNKKLEAIIGTQINSWQ